jgi:AcrR family transcriptional regulator
MGVKLPSAADRRVQRTHRALREALLALMIERGWDGFSVQDVCDRADVGRSTFYTHFADKEELVGGSFEDLRRTLRAQAAAASGADPRPLAFSRGLIEHAHEQRRLFLAIVGKRSGHLVQRKFRELVVGLVRDDLAGVLPAGQRRDAAAAFLAGALLELLTWSLETKSSLETEALDVLFHQLAAPVLAEAGRGRR